MLDFTVIWKTFGRLATRVPYTITIAFVSILLSTALAILLSMVKIKKVKIAGALVELYLLFPKNAPVTAVLIVTYVLYSAPGQAENIRTAIQSVPKGQYEAAYCSGLSSFQTFRRIIFPQALTVLLPISLTVYLGNIKGMSVAFMIGVVDIMSQAKLCSALNFGYVEAYLAAAVVYWVLCVGLTKLFTSCETILYRKKGIAVS